MPSLRPLPLVLLAVGLPGSVVAVPAAVAAPLVLGGAPAARAVPGGAAAALEVSFSVKAPVRGRRVLVALPASGVSLATDGRGRLELRRGGKAVRRGLPLARRGWTRVRLRTASATWQADLEVGRARAAVGVPGLRAERRVQVGSRGPRVLLDKLVIRARPAAAPAPAAPSPAPGTRAPAQRGSASAGAAAPAPAPGPAPSGAAGSSAAPAPATAAPPAKAPERVFGPSTFWNAPLADDAPLDPKSSTWVAELIRQVEANDPWINTWQFSTPVYTIGPDQPTVRVVLDTNYAPVQRTWEAVPIPPGAKAARGTDQHLVIHQPSTDTMWEFWKAQEVDGVWHARWGGRMTDMDKGPGHFAGAQATWGATATSLPLLGGLMRLDEVRHGRIDHALALAIPHAQARNFSWPAQRTDGADYSEDAIPEGARFRLDPRLDLDTLRLPPIVRMMAEAAQRYGIVVRDRSGVVVFYGEDATPTGVNPWGGPGFFAGQYPNRLLERFPWKHLQVLQTQMRCCWHA